MEKFTLFHLYLGLFLLGVGYATVAVLMGQIIGGGGHDGDAGGHDAGGGEASHDAATLDSIQHHGDLGDASTDGMPTLSPWSPVTIASFVTTFGGVGLILDRFHFPGFLSFPVATVSGVAFAAGVFYLFYRVFRITQSTSGVSAFQTIGHEANVITAIPERGVGEIAYVLGGRRFNAPARTEDGRPVPAKRSVVIVRKAGGIFFVREVASAPPNRNEALPAEKAR